MDRRKFCRVRVSAKAKLFVTGDARETDCVVATLSPGGAGIICKKPPPARTNIVLYISGFGRFEGATTKLTRDGIGVRFDCTARKRQRTVEQLTSFVKEGIATGIMQLTYYNRAALEVSDRPSPEVEEIEVTPAMLSAGEAEARSWDEPNPHAPHILMAVYIAMARLDGRAQAFGDQPKQLQNPRKRIGVHCGLGWRAPHCRYPAWTPYPNHAGGTSPSVLMSRNCTPRVSMTRGDGDGTARPFNFRSQVTENHSESFLAWVLLINS